MNKAYQVALACCGVVILLLCYQVDKTKDEIQSFKTAQAVAENNALQQQQATEEKWQAKLNSAEDEHQANLQDLERRYDDAVRSLDSVQQSASDDKRSALPSSTATSCNTKTGDNSRRIEQSYNACKKSVLNFAKERDECAVKYNTLLKLYQQVQQDTANAN